MLTEQQIPTPGTLEYRRTGSTRRYHPGYECKWATNTVVHILENREYTGCLVNFKTEKLSYKVKHSVENPPEKQAIFENHHEPIKMCIRDRIMSGELKTGDPIPSMRALAKSIHVSVITVQKAYEDLQRDGFIETTVGRGSFVSAQNKDFYQEEQQRLAEEHLQEAADIGRISGISLEKLIELLTIFYQEED